MLLLPHLRPISSLHHRTAVHTYVSWRRSSEWTPITRLPFPRAGQPWTESEIIKLRELRAAGRSQVDIASELGRSFSAIGSAPDRAPIRRFKPWTEEDIARLHSLRAQGRDDQSIADTLGRTPRNVKLRLHRESRSDELRLRYRTGDLVTSYRPRSWSRDEVQKLIDLREKGHTAREIAPTMARSRRSVEHRLKRLQQGDTGCRYVYSAREDEQLAQLKAAGLSWSMIQAAMPQRSAARWMARYHLRQAENSSRSKMGLAWSQDDINKLHKVRADGASRAEIACELGRTISSVDRLLKDRKVTPVVQAPGDSHND